MTRLRNIFLLFIGLALSLGLSYNLYTSDLINYMILSGTISFILFASLIIYTFNTRNDASRYKSFIRDKINAYSSILIESDNLPDISEKNIVKISSFQGLIDAQIEIRKPIYFKEGEDSTPFVLIDEEQACFYVHKKDENVISEFEVEVDKILAFREGQNLDHSLLDEIDKTTIIKFDNDKSYKVSPIKNEKKEEELDIPVLKETKEEKVEEDSKKEPKQEEVKFEIDASIKDVTPIKYNLKNGILHYKNSDNKEFDLNVENLTSMIKTLDENNNVIKITLKTNDTTCILKQVDNTNLDKLEKRLHNKLVLVNTNCEEKTEYNN